MVHVRLTVTSSPRAARSTVKTHWKKKKAVEGDARWLQRKMVSASFTHTTFIEPSAQFFFFLDESGCFPATVDLSVAPSENLWHEEACVSPASRVGPATQSPPHLGKNVNQIFFLRQCGCMFFDLRSAASSSSSSSLSGASRLSAPRQPDSPTKTSLSPLGGGCFCYFQGHASRPPIGNLHRHIFLWDFGSTHVECCHAAVLERSRTCPSARPSPQACSPERRRGSRALLPSSVFVHLATCRDSACHETQHGARHMHDSQLYSERPLHDAGAESITWSSQATYMMLLAQ